MQPEAPASLDHIVKTCLEKDPARRWQDVRDLVAELRWIADNGGDGGFGVAAGSSGRGRSLRVWLRRAGLAAAAGVIALLAWPATLYMQGTPEPEELRFRVPRNLTAQPDETQGGNSASGGQATFSRTDSAISPDGRSIAFVARPIPADTSMLYIRPVGAVTPRRLAGTENASLPFWSDDGQFIAFVGGGGKLRKVPIAGGAPQDLAEVPGFTGGTWNRMGTILYGSAAGIFRLSAEGGAAPQAVTTVDKSHAGHFFPHFLPDGRHFLFFVKHADPSQGGVFVGDLDSKDLKRVIASDTNAVYVDPGYLVFQRGAAVFAQPFSTTTLTASGEPVRLADEVSAEATNGHGLFDASRNGVLIYFASTQGGGAGGEETWEFQMQWADTGGQTTTTVGPRGFYRGMELSPDGKRVAVHRHDGAGGDIWVMEPPPLNPKRITFDATVDNSSPIWSPGGDKIVFASHRNGKWGLYVTQSDGSGTDGELLLESDLPKAPLSWSSDGKRLVYWVQDQKTLGDIWILPFDDKKPVPFLASTKNETHAQVSPDGKWIAYTSELTGRKEVYVQPFPTGTGRWQISPDAGLGGDWPRWRGDSQELYYHALGNAGAYGVYTNGLTILGPLFAASIKATGGSIEAGTPVEMARMLAVRIPHAGADYHTYAVSRDGKRLLLFQRALVSGTTVSQIGPEFPIQGLTVAMNLKALRRH